MIERLLLFLWILKEVPQEIQPKQLLEKILAKDEEDTILKQIHHQKKIINQEELRKQEKKRMIWRWDFRNMFEWYERARLRKWLPIVEIPENNAKDHFRGDMDRALKMNKEQVDLERGRRYMKNVEEVLSHKTKVRWI